MHTTKIVINKSYAGFSLSHEAMVRLRDLGVEEAIRPLQGLEDGITCDSYSINMARDDHRLISVVEELGKAANGAHALLSVVEIPEIIGQWHMLSDRGYETIYAGPIPPIIG